MLLAYLVAGHI